MEIGWEKGAKKKKSTIHAEKKEQGGRFKEEGGWVIYKVRSR